LVVGPRDGREAVAAVLLQQNVAAQQEQQQPVGFHPAR
jgi:hypothetical protein